MKKDKNRFTIKFTPDDPRHQIAVEALEKMGRRKAGFIADAVCDYLARYWGNGAAGTMLPPSLPASLTNVVHGQNAVSSVSLMQAQSSEQPQKHAEEVLAQISQLKPDLTTKTSATVSDEPNVPIPATHIEPGPQSETELEADSSSDTDIEDATIDSDLQEAVLSGLSAFNF